MLLEGIYGFEKATMIRYFRMCHSERLTMDYFVAMRTYSRPRDPISHTVFKKQIFK